MMDVGPRNRITVSFTFSSLSEIESQYPSPSPRYIHYLLRSTMTGTTLSGVLVQDMHIKQSSRTTRGMSRSSHNIRSQLIQKLGISSSTSPHHAERSVRDLRHIPRFRQQLQYDRNEERLYLEQRKSRQLSSSPTSNGELAHAVSGKAKQRRQVKFHEGVIVAPIPMRNEYSDRTRSKLWNDPEELQANIARNRIEFSAESCNWWLACHEGEMYKCGVTGDLIHPVHVRTNQYVFEHDKVA